MLVHQSDQAQRDRGQTETLQLVRRDPFLADKRSIELLESALGELSLTEEANKFWDRVIANAENKELAMEHLHRCIAINSWSDAQKVRLGSTPERKYSYIPSKRRRLTWGHLSADHNGFTKSLP